MPYLTILFFIPLTELFLVPFKCENNKLLVEEVQCYKNKHLILAILGVFGEITFVIFIIILNYFYFYPFVSGKSTIKLNPYVDLLLIKIKLIFVIQNFFVKNQYVIISILLILSLILIYFNLNRTIYAIKGLELLINLRNVLVFWAIFILLISRICLKSHFNNIIFLLVLSYPLVIFGFIMFYHRLENQIALISFGNNDINSCLTRIKIFIELINSFIEEHKSVMKFGENLNHKNEILLKGIIKIHTDNCLKEDCPLTNFIRNEDNFSTQKQCLLNYMTIVFNESIKKYPNNILIRMYYIQFNYDQKYNLNSVKTTFEEIKNLKFDINSEFILHCQKKHISLMQLNENNEENDEEKEKLILEQNYKRLKSLISNATKLFIEFWGIFANNITNNLNTSKLYKLGEKLNSYLNEIHNLWKNNLRYKKIGIEYQNVTQLFARFLREILWDQKKSEAVQKKINEEQYLQGYNQISDKKKINITNISSIENQGYVIYVNATDKGKCNIIQFSNSLSFIIGYQKQELINKSLEVLMPSILTEGHSKTVEKYIKSSLKEKNNDNIYNLNESENKTTFILIKNKMGYIIPFNAKFSLYDDNDFSNSFLIKAELETTDVKSVYAYYLLTKPDFSLECFSSSAIHLGLSMDLLKKYVIKLNILIRTGKDKKLDLFEKYKDYENNQRLITWVFPDVIYPKENNNNEKNRQIERLIDISIKEKCHLQIFEIKYKEKEISGFVFKIYDTKNTYKKKENSYKKNFIPSDKTQIIFDLMNLNYIRTIIVKKKSGLRNLRDEEKNDIEEKDNKNNENKEKKRGKKNNILNLKSESSEEGSIQVIITKEKLLELQTNDSKSIKSFINILTFYGNDTSLIKHRPNKEKYSTGKAQEPLIKISLNNFTKRIEARIKENPELLKNIKYSQDEKISVNMDISKNNDNNSGDEKIQDENKNVEFENEIYFVSFIF